MTTHSCILSVNLLGRKYFNENEFLIELSKIDWNETCASGDPVNVMWSKWLLNFTQFLDRYAPLKKKRLGKKRSPWITYIVVQKMRYRDNLKKQYEMTRNDVLWKLYKNARNDVNNIIKQAKCDYFKNKIDAVKKDPNLEAYKRIKFS